MCRSSKGHSLSWAIRLIPGCLCELSGSILWLYRYGVSTWPLNSEASYLKHIHQVRIKWSAQLGWNIPWKCRKPVPIKGSALRADLKYMYKFSYNKLILLIKIFMMDMIYLPGCQLSRVLLTSPTSHFAYSHFTYFRCIAKSHFAYI